MSTKPKRTLRSETLKSALQNFLVSSIIERHEICCYRTLWDVRTEDLPKAELEIWAKRQQIDNIIKSFKVVKLFFSCMTALECSSIRKHVKNRHDKSADKNNSDECDDFEDTNKYIPGKNIVYLQYN